MIWAAAKAVAQSSVCGAPNGGSFALRVPVSGPLVLREADEVQEQSCCEAGHSGDCLAAAPGKPTGDAHTHEET